MKIMTAEEAAALIQDGMTVALGGFGVYSVPDALQQAVADRYARTGHPKGITVMDGISTGNFKPNSGLGLSRMNAEGLIDTIYAGHISNPVDISMMVAENKIAAYILPLGVISHLFRAMAGKKPGILTTVGLGTCADPREEGCIANEKARAQGRPVVELVELGGEEYLFYRIPVPDVCLIRGTYADEKGNISLAHEPITESQMQIAAAVHNHGGTVIVQVEDIVPADTLPPREVRIHKSLVDIVVKADPEYRIMSYGSPEYRPELTGEVRAPQGSLAPMEMGIRKIIARRGAMELKPGSIINLGIGIPSGVGSVADEEGLADGLTMSLESGPVGGVPLEGLDFAASANPEQIASIPDTFDLYDGGWLDMTCLGAAEIDREGNVNVSRFGTRCTGPGGFINISQNTPKVCFMFAFTPGKPVVETGDGSLRILEDGAGCKFVERVQQITFSGAYARKTSQEILYITERAVFRLTDRGVTLTEIAPGVDLKKDILAHMEFMPAIADDLKIMDPRLFRTEKMGLAEQAV